MRPDAERFQDDLLLKCASRASDPDSIDRLDISKSCTSAKASERGTFSGRFAAEMRLARLCSGLIYQELPPKNPNASGCETLSDGFAAEMRFARL